MNKNFGYINLLLLSSIFSSCASLKQSPKNELQDGIYHSSIITRHGDRVYMETHTDTVLAFAAKKEDGEYIVDKAKPIRTFDKIKTNITPNKYSLYKPSLDLDFLTIPLKYRPETSDFPRQLNSTVNGAVYLGSRYDLFKINYDKTPLGTEERDINHFGFSIGLLAGLGATDMNPWVTSYAIDSEYSGVVFTKGLATIIGFNKFSVGVTVGTDNLLDRNYKFWIYENKLWIGLAFSLNLN